MATIGLSVPPGLTISTEACQEYQENGKKIPHGLWEEILKGLDTVEKEMRASLGNPSKPLLLSVRSGAAIAKEAEFFSFGTNDLTQMTFGYSRDDVGRFLPTYLASGILRSDPFEVLDQKGVGQLIKICTEKGHAARPNLKIGICGEHGGEPSSVAFFSNIGLDYVFMFSI